MKVTGNFLKNSAIATLLVAGGISMAQAATYSTTKAELLFGQDYKRGPNLDNDETILTLTNATGFTKGDSYFFVDLTNIDNRDETGGTHLEWGPRLSLLRTFGDGQWDGLVKDIFLIVQGDYTSNKFVTKWVKMGGVSVDWNVPGFKFVKTHVQHRDDPTLAGDSVQFNLIWNSGFTIAEQNFSFEGFLDWTSPEGDRSNNLLAQPQLLWHPSKQLGVGIEYQYWKNRLGIKGRDEKVPQLMVRWTF